MHEVSCLDRKIIRCLSDDARMPVSKVAETLGVPDSTVRHRLARLTESGVISFVTLTDPLKLGYRFWVMIGLKVDLGKIQDILKRLAEFQEIYFVAAATGSFDVIVNAVFISDGHLFRFLSESLSRVDGVKDTVTFVYIAIPKRQMVIQPPEIESESAGGI